MVGHLLPKMFSSTDNRRRFQAIKGTSAVQSGIRTIPLLLAMVIIIIMVGALVQKIGYYTPFMIIGAVIMPIGAGLLTTLKVSSGAGEWIGYQVLAGVGMGAGLQQSNLAAQKVASRRDSSMAVALVILCQTLGGAIFAAVSQNIIDQRLIENLRSTNIPGINAATIINAGATTLRTVVPAEHLDRFLALYNDAIMKGLDVAVACACMTIVPALMMEWLSVKKPVATPTPKDTEEGQQQAAGDSTIEKEQSSS